MGNALRNAGGLDGVTNWNVVGGGVLAVDESVVGAPGRGVFVQSANAANAPTAKIYSDPQPVGAGQSVEVFGWWQTVGGDGYGIYVEWLSAQSVALVPVTAIPLVTATKTPGIQGARGLPFKFNYSYARVVAPAGAAFMRIGVATNLAVGAAYSLTLLKPYMAIAPTTARPTLWDPGTHANPDLQLVVWPSTLPQFQADELPSPLPNMVSYSSDTNIATTRDLYSALQYSYTAKMRLEAYQVDVLDQFYLDVRTGFFLVRPDTSQLCVAFWRDDGAPKPVQNVGSWTFYEVGLRLAVT